MTGRLAPLLAAIALLAAPAAAGALAYPDPPPRVADGSSLTRVVDDLADPSLLALDPLVVQLYGTGRHKTASGPRGATVTLGSPDTYRPALKKIPWADPSRDVWAPTVYTFTGKRGAVGYGMYFTAPRADTGQHCLGTAKAAAANGPFRPTKNMWCADGLEAIDPTVVNANGLRYIVFKTSDENEAPFAIRALPMLGKNGLAFSPGAPATVAAGSERMENPSFVSYGGTVWMFLSRLNYADCSYYTDAWSSTSFPGTGASFVPRRQITSSGLTRRAKGRPGKPGLCGPGGAAVSPDPINGTYRIVLHASHKIKDAHKGDPRDTYFGTVLWDAAGVPYVD